MGKKSGGGPPPMQQDMGTTAAQGVSALTQMAGSQPDPSQVAPNAAAFDQFQQQQQAAQQAAGPTMWAGGSQNFDDSTGTYRTAPSSLVNPSPPVQFARGKGGPTPPPYGQQSQSGMASYGQQGRGC